MSFLVHTIKFDEPKVVSPRSANVTSDESFICFKALLSGTNGKHQSLGSIGSHLNERSTSRAPLLRRITSPDIVLYFLYAMSASTPFLIELLNHGVSTFLALPGPLIKLLECIVAALVPVIYMVFPPTMPDREDMLETGVDGVRRPKRRDTKPSNRISYVDALECLIICRCFGWI